MSLHVWTLRKKALHRACEQGAAKRCSQMASQTVERSAHEPRENSHTERTFAEHGGKERGTTKCFDDAGRGIFGSATNAMRPHIVKYTTTNRTIYRLLVLLLTHPTTLSPGSREEADLYPSTRHHLHPQACPARLFLLRLHHISRHERDQCRTHARSVLGDTNANALLSLFADLGNGLESFANHLLEVGVEFY